MNNSRRLIALDVMRGITVAGMILVNNPGSWSYIYAPLRHAEWHGLTPTDLVFPFFMFIMGVSTAISLRRFSFKLSRELAFKILRRTAVIFLIGLLLDRIGAFCWGIDEKSWLISGLTSAFDLSNIRVMGVLQRLAICYGCTAVIGALMTRKAIVWLITTFLFAYSVILLLFDGLDFSDGNIIGVIDRAILGANHMYHEHAGGMTLALDPEGLLSTLPSIAHTLIGFLAGRMILATPDIKNRMLNLLLAGTALMFAGMLLDYGLPINKKIWSPTFVMTTCGMASSLLALIIFVVDVKGYSKWTTCFKVFGINPLFLYIMSDVLAVLIDVTLQGAPFRWFQSFCFSPEMASMLYAVSFVALNWLIGYPLYRRHIIIKI